MSEAFSLDAEGWLRPHPRLTRLPSPNYDARPADSEPDLVVLHNISLPPGEFDGLAVARLFTNTLDCAAHPYYAQLQGLKVSAHFFIGRDGALTQFVSCAERAWHAGASNFLGRPRCNDFSIGIEFAGTDDIPYEDAQYQTLAALLPALSVRYPIAHLAGHADIAPGRKTDPGAAFDWPRVVRESGLPSPYLP